MPLGERIGQRQYKYDLTTPLPIRKYSIGNRVRRDRSSQSPRAVPIVFKIEPRRAHAAWIAPLNALRERPEGKRVLASQANGGIT